MNVLSILDMHRLIEQDIQKFGFYVDQDFDSEQVDLQLNKQISALITGIVDKHFGRLPKIGPEEGFQVDQVSLDNLRLQHVKDDSTTLSDTTDGVKFTLPVAYSYHIKTIVTTSHDCICNGKKTETKTDEVAIRIAESQFDMKKHPFHKTHIDSPLAEIAGNIVYIYTNSNFKITNAKISYIKKPAIVKYNKDIDGNYTSIGSVDCDLDATLHQMVCDMTSIRIMKILEQNPHKILNIQQEIT